MLDERRRIDVRRFCALAALLSACNGPSTHTPGGGATAAPPTAATTAPPATAASAAQPAATASASADPADDPIARLVAQLSKQPLWTNGLSPKIDLPEGASTSDVLGRMFERIGFDSGRVTSHRIVDERRVVIAPETRPYTAVVVETNLGRKVVLLRYESPAVGWWSRVFPP